ncbi:MAG: DUF2924 domain-containing protein, partial [Alphaproteobacteria bacterium]|nr:DUF2924 domain-containing protein [Alphaproteobacteria bacterium]
KDIIARMIAFRIQEQAFGGLEKGAVTLLERLARGDKPGAMNRRLKPGTVLVREHNGERHTVTVDPRRLPLAGGNLRQPLHHRADHYRYGLEWPAILRAADAYR